MIAQRKLERKWSVVEKQGSYIAQVTEANSRAKMEGWRVVGTNLTLSEACEYRDSLITSTNTQTPDLSDILVWDYTDTVEARQLDSIDEYDTINARCSDNVFRTGVVLMWDGQDVLMEVGNILYVAVQETATLIAKIEDSGWAEYEEYLDEINEDYEYEFSTSFGASA